MTAPAFLPPLPAARMLNTAIQAERARREAQATAAASASARAWPLFERMNAMLRRAESACCSNRDAEMCGELEDLERLIGQVLRGAA